MNLLTEDITFEEYAGQERQKQADWEARRSFDKPYKVHASQGQGDMIFNSFDTLEEALAEIEEHHGEASFGIEYPDGRWHKWTEG